MPCGNHRICGPCLEGMIKTEKENEYFVQCHVCRATRRFKRNPKRKRESNLLNFFKIDSSYQKMSKIK